ncbi:ABC transporter permease subunit [Micromonospora siamensis]|uniref:ABC-2 family transporter protein n=1 Tax=Micromonospora siamensis TaxID=299152 RepID=A0A1C5HXT8_9ACTN|nr:ABC transporter permease subunit [Micromonospora siamensis]SCG50778.1 ABC-2 family transporter protein [Micromonospora siamensis]
MIWMSWRQFRTQALVAAAVLVVVAAWLLVLGSQIRHQYATEVAPCPGDCAAVAGRFLDTYRSRVYALDALLLAVPALLGVFWGAPLVARELETGTHRLAWNQSVTRRRWLAAKLAVAALAAAVTAGALSALAGWAVGRYDQVAAGPYDPLGAGRFSTLLFGARDLTPVGYAVFAVVVGALLGLLLRRTVPAMAVTLLLFVAVQVLVPNLVRPHLMRPAHADQPMTAERFERLAGLGGPFSDTTVKGLKIPDAWVTSTSPLLTATGRPLSTAEFRACEGRSWQCLADLDLHVAVAYQPNDRYWAFQLREAGIFLAAALLLAGLGAVRIQRRRD